MSGRTKKETCNQVNEFHCCNKAIPQKDFVEHLVSVHGFVKGTQCNRMLVQALHSDIWFQNKFAWEIPCRDGSVRVSKWGLPIKGQMLHVTQVIRGPRQRDGIEE